MEMTMTQINDMLRTLAAGKAARRGVRVTGVAIDPDDADRLIVEGELSYDSRHVIETARTAMVERWRERVAGHHEEMTFAVVGEAPDFKVAADYRASFSAQELLDELVEAIASMAPRPVVEGAKPEPAMVLRRVLLDGGWTILQSLSDGSLVAASTQEFRDPVPDHADIVSTVAERMGAAGIKVKTCQTQRLAPVSRVPVDIRITARMREEGQS